MDATVWQWREGLSIRRFLWIHNTYRRWRGDDDDVNNALMMRWSSSSSRRIATSSTKLFRFHPPICLSFSPLWINCRLTRRWRRQCRTTTATNDDTKRKFKSEVDPEIERLVKEFHVQDGGGTASTNNDDGDSWVVEKKRHGHTTAQTVVAEKAVVEVDNPFDVLGVEDDEEEETTTLAKDLNYSMRSADLKDNMNKKKKKKKFWLF